LIVDKNYLISIDIITQEQLTIL